MKILKRIEKLILNLSTKNLKLAIAESCTGGYISHMITNISGASNVFERGIICYSNQAKIDLLKIDPQIIVENGVVSEAVVKLLAENIRSLSNVDIGIGISGIAGPTGGTPEKPVGLVFIGISTKNKKFCQRYNFKEDRITFKKRVLETVIQKLEELI
jgi:nicotinamide-nucleotide amidase